MMPRYPIAGCHRVVAGCSRGSIPIQRQIIKHHAWHRGAGVALEVRNSAAYWHNGIPLDFQLERLILN